MSKKKKNKRYVDTGRPAIPTADKVRKALNKQGVRSRGNSWGD